MSHVKNVLNNGEKILDGSVNDIKESHRDGNFRLIYRSDKAISLSIPNEVHLVQNNADIKKGVFIAELQSQKQSASQIIKNLSSQVDTISFEEIIPCKAAAIPEPGLCFPAPNFSRSSSVVISSKFIFN